MLGGEILDYVDLTDDPRHVAVFHHHGDILIVEHRLHGGERILDVHPAPEIRGRLLYRVRGHALLVHQTLEQIHLVNHFQRFSFIAPCHRHLGDPQIRHALGNARQRFIGLRKLDPATLEAQNLAHRAE